MVQSLIKVEGLGFGSSGFLGSSHDEDCGAEVCIGAPCCLNPHNSSQQFHVLK